MAASAYTVPTERTHRFIEQSEVEVLTILPTSERYHCIATGTFPPRTTLGPKLSAWVEAEVLEWLKIRIAIRSEVAA